MDAELANARIVDVATIDISKVSILTKVTITNKATKKSMTYQIVSEKEADLKQQKISVTSPIGKGLLGKRVGEEAEVIAPNGKIIFSIDNITI
jgi:transcription elongation factor GreA